MTSLSPAHGKPLLAVRGLRKSYGAVQAVRGIDLDVRERELCCLMGPNGSGKSTFFDCVTGLQQADAPHCA
jgi:branched-chain amino acid transport system ATP-binding protein